MKNDKEAFFVSGYGLNTFSMKCDEKEVVFRPSLIFLGVVIMFLLPFVAAVPYFVSTGDFQVNIYTVIVSCIFFPLFIYGLLYMWLKGSRKKAVFNLEQKKIVFYQGGKAIQEIHRSEISSVEMGTVERTTRDFTPYTAYQLLIHLKKGPAIILLETQYRAYVDKALKAIKDKFL